MNVKSIAEIIDSLIENSNLKKANEVWEIHRAFEEAVGEEFRNNLKITGIRDGVLKVKVPSSVWAMELSFFEKEIIYKMNNRLGGEFIKRIDFKEV